MGIQNLRALRLLLGFVTGILLWLIWQTSAITSPDSESSQYANFLANLPAGSLDFFRPWTREDYISIFHFAPPNSGHWWTFGKIPSTDAATVHMWIGFLPLACLLGVLFSTLKPLPRFLVWIFSLLAAGALVLYCYQTFNYQLPLSPPIIVLSCFYLCGTVIYLETEKIERNRTLAIDLQQEAENERKRIAKDFHDETLQSMSRIIRLVNNLHEENPENPIPTEIRNKLETCITETRNIINELHPAALEAFGLGPSIENLVEDFKNSTGVKANFNDRTNGMRLAPLNELCIYRIAQEAINNVEKHANASELIVSLEMKDKSLVLKVSDNGKGNVQRKKRSHGLQNIEDRARLMNGDVDWRLPEDFSSGTMLLLKVPLA